MNIHIKRFKRLIALFALFLPACPPGPVYVPQDADSSAAPIPEPEAAAPVVTADDAGVEEARRPKKDAAAPNTLIGRACAQMQFVGCEEGLDTPKGEHCEQVYTDQAAFPGLAHLNAACVIVADSIDKMRKCKVKCGGK